MNLVRLISACTVMLLASDTAGAATFSEAQHATKARIMRYEPAHSGTNPREEVREDQEQPADADDEGDEEGPPDGEDEEDEEAVYEGRKTGSQAADEERGLAQENSSIAAQLHIAEKESRHQCPYYQQMSCLLDVLEKSCEPDVEGGSLLVKTATESAWMCCCPTPYKSCKKSERIGVCSDAMNTNFGQLTTFVQRDFNLAVQKVRGAMQSADAEKCGILAAAEPSSQCGFEAEPKVSRSMARADLFCEMLTWQWEELGDGNMHEFKENGCPFRKQDKGKGGNARKGHRLLKGEV